MRESPAVSILPALLEKGALICAQDPKGMEETKKYLPEGIQYVEDAYKACDGADVVVLMTEWNQYRALDLDRIASLVNSPVFVDLRNVYDPQTMKDKGFVYVGVG